jgi:hypothetical protein
VEILIKQGLKQLVLINKAFQSEKAFPPKELANLTAERNPRHRQPLSMASASPSATRPRHRSAAIVHRAIYAELLPMPQAFLLRRAAAVPTALWLQAQVASCHSRQRGTAVQTHRAQRAAGPHKSERIKTRADLVPGPSPRGPSAQPDTWFWLRSRRLCPDEFKGGCGLVVPASLPPAVPASADPNAEDRLIY